MTKQKPWPRAVILVDMDAFFAAIEQLDQPSLRGRPVAITNGLRGTCIITCSYEARARGVKTGMRLAEARRRCPGLVQRAARPVRYAEVSRRIMRALHDITPDLEVFSVDEAFLDVTRCQRLWGSPAQMGELTRQRVRAAAGLSCSVGVSGDKTTAKYAAQRHKPGGIGVIPPWQARATLHDVPVTELCGINRGIGRFLAERGVHTCGDMARLPIGVLGQRFGNPGRRIWYMCHGADPEPVHGNVPPPRSIGHGKVMPPDTRDPALIHTYLLHMTEKVAARLRLHEMAAQTFAFGLRTQPGWIGGKRRSRLPCNDGRSLLALGRQAIADCWQGQGVFQIQVTALDPRPARGQLDLFDQAETHAGDAAMDAVNQRYGEFCLAPARLLQRSDMPNVISPAWRPFGHRQTIQDAAMTKPRNDDKKGAAP